MTCVGGGGGGGGLYVYIERTSALEDQVYRVGSDVVANVLLPPCLYDGCSFNSLSQSVWSGCGTDEDQHTKQTQL